MKPKEKGIRPEKQAIVDEVRSRYESTTYLFLTDCANLDTSKTRDLRDRLREVRSEFHVVRNRLFRIAAGEEAAAALEKSLTGPTGMVTGEGDAVSVAKVLKKFFKETDLSAVKAGSLEGEFLTAADVNQLAELPSKEQLLGMLVGTIAGPMRQLMGVCSQKMSSVLYLLNARAEAMEGTEA